MRKLLLMTIILLSGCQSIEPKQTLHKKRAAQTANTKPSALYDRYKYKSNRYTQKQDAPPTKNHKVSFIEPKPIKEPLSRYGNPSDYSVDGHHYEIMKNTKGYKSTGIASWYGTKFHKQRTSSGEPYNMYVMTAAHKTLPLPTYISVKNLSNGKRAVVKVNDRGPFHSDRIIDLSYAAAVRLGIYPQGTAPVEIEALMGPEVQSKYFIQAGAFTTQASAAKLRQQLKTITKEQVVIEHFNNHYIVRVGPLNNKFLADSLKTKLAKNGVSGSFSVLI